MIIHLIIQIIIIIIKQILQVFCVCVFVFLSKKIDSVVLGIDRYNRCLVCNDRASGIHFGVSTCEACKAFFRRTTLSNYSMADPCSPNRCEINIKNRNNCPSCRFDKCKRLGMDRDNVIYGKPSKQQNQSFYQQDYFREQLTNISNDLMKIFPTIHSIDNKQQIETFGNLAFHLFYEQTSPVSYSKRKTTSQSI
jgi:hypothetical protein